MSEIAIRVHNLSKLYRIGQRNNYITLRDTLANAVKSPLRSLRANGGSRSSTDGRDNTFWALKNVSFEVKRGESVGIVGPNGAGKTTLLKILCRITKPTVGYAEVCGRVGSLLEVGTGFHPELTGRENVFMNGAILGMKRREIERKFDEIVAFAEVEKFIDTPVKHYSSGMCVRLAFAVAAHLEPEILLVDDALAVGDVSFQKKCLGKMGDISSEGRTVLFVSHNMSAINRLCRWAMWLDKGDLRMAGTVEDVGAAYLSVGANVEGERRWEKAGEIPGNEKIHLLAVRVTNPQGDIIPTVDVRFSFHIEIEYEVLQPLHGVRVGFWLLTSEGVVVFAAGDNEDRSWEGIRREPGSYVSACEVPGMLLKSGVYFLTVGADIPGISTLFLEGSVLRFHVEQTEISGAMAHRAERLPGVICPSLRWRISMNSGIKVQGGVSGG